MNRLLVFLLILLYISNTLQDLPIQPGVVEKKTVEKKSNIDPAVKNKHAPSITLNIENSTNIPKLNQKESHSKEVKPDNSSNSYAPSIEPGADLRLISVISLIALCCLICIGYKMYR